MTKLLTLILATFFFRHTFGAEASEKCRKFLDQNGTNGVCCKLPNVIDDKTMEELKKHRINSSRDFCATLKTFEEKLAVANFEKAAYKSYLSKTIKDAEWLPIFEKNLDFCMDLTPKLAPLLVKKINETMESCDIRFPVAMGCVFVKSAPECPKKYFNENDECKEAKTTVADCTKDPEEIIKLAEYKLSKVTL